MIRPAAVRLAPLLLLAACQADPAPPGDAAAAAPVPPGMAAMPVPPADGQRVTDPVVPAAPAPAATCAQARGPAEAARLVQACIRVSPATHPPCNVQNSCAAIETEIARSCRLLGADAAAIPECRPLPDSAAAAAAVVRRYYDAIDARDFATAWTQWGPDGRPGQAYAAFEAGFARTRSSVADVGEPATVEGGAGSLYAEVPVTVTAVLEDGRRQRFTGTYVVRRVNDVDGAEPWRRQWHLDTATLRPVPAG